MKRWNCKGKPLVSTILVMINIIVFLICTFTGDLLYNKGSLDLWNVMVNREYGRLLTSMFLHSGINHLFNNMLILFFLGAMLEKETGHVSYAILYFLSGLGGNVFSLLSKHMVGNMSASIGASGVVFGLDGVLLAMVLLSRKKMPTVTPVRVVLMIVLSLYNGYLGQNIDNAAHVGGLLTGFAAGVIMCVIERRREE